MLPPSGRTRARRKREDEPMLNIIRKSLGTDIAVLEIGGRIVLGRECRDVEWNLEDLLKENQRKIIFDLTGVNHVDSTGVGILVTCYGKVKQAGGELRLTGVQEPVAKVLKMTQVDQVLRVYPTVDAASEGFQ
jgi:anti-sigma B factor antagonist